MSVLKKRKKVKPIKLNEEQHTLVASMVEFMKDRSENAPKFLMVNAAGGTGKSTCVAALAKHLSDLNKMAVKFDGVNEMDSIVITATTNPAVSELVKALTYGGKAMPNSVKAIATIHKVLSLRVFDNYSTGEQDIRYVKNPVKHPDYRTVLIDEASMLSERMVVFMDEMLPNAKFIMVGDAEQLLSVGDNRAYFYHKHKEHLEIFKNNRANEEVFKKYIAELRMNVRNKFLAKIPKQVGESLYLLKNAKKFSNTLIDAYRHDPSVCRTLCFTNNAVNDYIQDIRVDVLDQTPDYIVGDFVYILNRIEGNVSLDMDGEMDIDQPLVDIVANSLVEIVNLSKSMEMQYGDTFIKGRMMEVATCETTSAIMFLPDSEQRLRSVIRNMKASRKYHDMFKLINTVPMLRLAYASTIHKSQGSSIDYVFVDLSDLEGLAHKVSQDMVARLVYVAISRARKQVFIYGNVPKVMRGHYEIVEET